MTISYDKEHGLLAIHNGFSEGDSFSTNIIAADVVLDISKNKEIVGIEILDLPTFLEGFMSVEEASTLCENLSNATFTAQKRSGGVFLTIIFHTTKSTISTHLALPTEPIAAV